MSLTSGSRPHVQSLPRALAPAFNRCSALAYLYSWRLSATVFSLLDAAVTGLFFPSCCDYGQLRQKKKKAEELHLPVCVSDEIKVGGGWGRCWGFSPSSRGKMDFYSCFVAKQTSSLKVRDRSATDSSCYLRRRPLTAHSERGEEKSPPLERQQWPLWRHALLFKKEGKASDVPHASFYGYNLR